MDRGSVSGGPARLCCARRSCCWRALRRRDAFDVPNFSVTPSTTQAGGHPNLTVRGRPYRHRRRGHPRPLPRPPAGADRKHHGGRRLLRTPSSTPTPAPANSRGRGSRLGHRRGRRTHAAADPRQRSTTSSPARPSRERSGSCCVPQAPRWPSRTVYIRGSDRGGSRTAPTTSTCSNVVLNQPRTGPPARRHPGRHHGQLADPDPERRRHARAGHLLPHEPHETAQRRRRRRVSSPTSTRR